MIGTNRTHRTTAALRVHMVRAVQARAAWIAPCIHCGFLSTVHAGGVPLSCKQVACLQKKKHGGLTPGIFFSCLSGVFLIGFIGMDVLTHFVSLVSPSLCCSWHEWRVRYLLFSFCKPSVWKGKQSSKLLFGGVCFLCCFVKKCTLPAYFGIFSRVLKGPGVTFNMGSNIGMQSMAMACGRRQSQETNKLMISAGRKTTKKCASAMKHHKKCQSKVWIGEQVVSFTCYLRADVDFVEHGCKRESANISQQR